MPFLHGLFEKFKLGKLAGQHRRSSVVGGGLTKREDERLSPSLSGEAYSWVDNRVADNYVEVTTAPRRSLHWHDDDDIQPASPSHNPNIDEAEDTTVRISKRAQSGETLNLQYVPHTLSRSQETVGFYIVNGAPSISISSNDGSRQTTISLSQSRDSSRTTVRRNDSSANARNSSSAKGRRLSLGKTAPQLYVSYTKPLAQELPYRQDRRIRASVRDGNLEKQATAKERPKWVSQRRDRKKSGPTEAEASSTANSSRETAANLFTDLASHRKHEELSRRIERDIFTSNGPPELEQSKPKLELFASAPQLPYIACGPSFAPFKDHVEDSNVDKKKRNSMPPLHNTRREAQDSQKRSVRYSTGEDMNGDKANKVALSPRPEKGDISQDRRKITLRANLAGPRHKPDIQDECKIQSNQNNQSEMKGGKKPAPTWTVPKRLSSNQPQSTNNAKLSESDSNMKSGIMSKDKPLSDVRNFGTSSHTHGQHRSKLAKQNPAVTSRSERTEREERVRAAYEKLPNKFGRWRKTSHKPALMYEDAAVRKSRMEETVDTGFVAGAGVAGDGSRHVRWLS